jgi:hypothetical protein
MVLLRITVKVRERTVRRLMADGELTGYRWVAPAASSGRIDLERDCRAIDAAPQRAATNTETPDIVSETPGSTRAMARWRRARIEPATEITRLHGLTTSIFA